METRMSRNLKILPIIAALIVMAVFAALLGISLVDQSQPQSFPLHQQPVLVSPGDFELYYVARTVFSVINIVLLVALISNYFNIYIKTRSEFTIGLLLFAVFFLMKEIAWSPFVVKGFGFGMFGLGPFAFLPDVFECIALSVLVYLSVKY